MSSTLTATILNNGFRFPPTRSSSCQNRTPLSSNRFAGKAAHRPTGSLGTHPGHKMSAVYHGPQAVAYESRLPAHEHHTLAQIERSRPYAQEVHNGVDNYDRHPSQSHFQQYQPQIPPQARHLVNSASHPGSRLPTRPSTPNSTHSSHPASGTNSANGDVQSMVLHSLQVPARISPKGGNLADFAAQLTCLFWFESPKILEAAETIRSTPQETPSPRLAKTAFPAEAFKKWVQTVLSTTQVTQNVILLALMFVYRLKMTNPSVRGRPGSEYRLLTVALMLGNKFLDDNTYTNKTWAEVSGISVQEIHVMEVEFLSNMRYALLASKEQWEEWLDKLGAYFEFWARVTRPASPAMIPPSPTLFIPSPTIGKGYSPLPSPTSSLQATQALFTSRSPKYSPPTLTSNHNAGYQQPFFMSSNNGNNVSPLANRPDLGNNRKRSWDEEAVDPPAKRAYRAAPQLTGPLMSSSTPNTKPPPDPRRLPIPNLTLNTAHHAPPVTQSQYPSAAYSMPQAVTLSLPPLESGMRAMSTVYAPPTNSWAPTNSGSSQPTMPSAPVLTTPTSHYPPTSNATYGTPTKRLSPINTIGTANYNGSSPLHEQFPHNGFATPISHSPSVYLQQRDSPYRPIRHVHTLLNPPPSSSLQGYHLPAIAPSQMHYQPIGRRDDYRTGIVPEYRNQAAYAGNPRNQGMTPVPSVPSQQRYPNLVN